MKEEKQYKILPNGKCQALNPFDGNYSPEQYDDFAEDNPPIDYIPHPEVKENDVVSGEVVWQYRHIQSAVWSTVKKIAYTRYKDYADFKQWNNEREYKTRQVIQLNPIAKELKTDVDKLYPCTLPLSVSGGCVGTSRHDKCKNCNNRADFIMNEIKQPDEKKEEKQNSENVIAYTGKGVGESNNIDVNDFVPIICGETCGCKKRLKSCPIGKGNQLNTPLRIDETKKSNAITYEQILTLPNNEHGHKFQPGYDNLDGNYNYFGTSPDAMRVMTVNADYVGHTFVNIKKDGGTRTVFNGHVRSFEELQLINSLVL